MERVRKAAIHILTLTTIHYKMNLLQIIFHVHSKAHQLSHVCQWRPVKIYSLDSHLLAFCRHAYHLMRSRQREKVSVCQRLKAPCQWVDMRWELRPRRWWSYSWAYVCCFLCALSHKPSQVPHLCPGHWSNFLSLFFTPSLYKYAQFKLRLFLHHVTLFHTVRKCHITAYLALHLQYWALYFLHFVNWLYMYMFYLHTPLIYHWWNILEC